MNISSLDRVRLLAAAQRHVDSSISKTCSVATDDTVESVDELYHLARQLGCKAVSYYRDGSREGQVLNSMKAKAEPPASAGGRTSRMSNVDLDYGAEPPAYAGGCARVHRPPELQGSTWRVHF